MGPVDLRPTTSALAALVRGVRDDQLTGPTPCPAYSVADLLDHIGGLSRGVRARRPQGRPPRRTRRPPTARGSRTAGATGSRPPSASSARRGSDPAAYDGITMAGPVEMPADQAALVALDEVTVHAWDLAVATGQPYPADPAAVAACRGFVAAFAPPDGGAADDGGLFGPPVAVPGRRLRPRPAHRCHRPRPRLDALTASSRISAGAAAARVTSPAVACPSGLRSTPRKRVWVQAHRGFKSHRHRQAIAPDHVVVRGVLPGQARRPRPRASGRSEPGSGSSASLCPTMRSPREAPMARTVMPLPRTTRARARPAVRGAPPEVTESAVECASARAADEPVARRRAAPARSSS